MWGNAHFVVEMVPSSHFCPTHESVIVNAATLVPVRCSVQPRRHQLDEDAISRPYHICDAWYVSMYSAVASLLHAIVDARHGVHVVTHAPSGHVGGLSE